MNCPSFHHLTVSIIQQVSLIHCYYWCIRSCHLWRTFPPFAILFQCDLDFTFPCEFAIRFMFQEKVLLVWFSLYRTFRFLAGMLNPFSHEFVPSYSIAFFSAVSEIIPARLVITGVQESCWCSICGTFSLLWPRLTYSFWKFSTDSLGSTFVL